MSAMNKLKGCTGQGVIRSSKLSLNYIPSRGVHTIHLTIVLLLKVRRTISSTARDKLVSCISSTISVLSACHLLVIQYIVITAGATLFVSFSISLQAKSPHSHPGYPTSPHSHPGCPTSICPPKRIPICQIYSFPVAHNLISFILPIPSSGCPPAESSPPPLHAGMLRARLCGKPSRCRGRSSSKL